MEHTFTHTTRRSTALEAIFVASIRMYIPKGERLIIGYSGGPDSEALLQLFLATNLYTDYELHLVHVDHGWRSESREEALQLQEKSRFLGLSFHLETLDSTKATGNLENWSRSCRLQVFKKIADQIGSSWVLLGHQRDDSIEVSLKRLMEGAHLVHAKGMDEYVQRDNLNLLRPLLGMWKDELVEYLRFKKNSWYEDRTNTNTKFLRAAMRTELFPVLEATFKKDVRHSILHVCEEAKLLEEHVAQSLEEQCDFVHTPRAVLITPKRENISSYLLCQALYQGSVSLGGCFSREQELQAVRVKSTPALFSKDGLTLYVDKRSFLLIRSLPLLPLPKEYVVQEEGEYTIGSWSVSVERKKSMLSACSVLDLFNNGFSMEIDALPLRIVPSTEANRRRYSSFNLQKEIMRHLPASIRKNIPMLVRQQLRQQGGNQELLASPNTYMIRFRCISF